MDRIKELTPILMSTWVPLWATVSWWVVHVSIAVIAWIAILRAYEKADYWWSIGIGFTTGLLPVSAYVFAPATEAIWIAGCQAPQRGSVLCSPNQRDGSRSLLGPVER